MKIVACLVLPLFFTSPWTDEVRCEIADRIMSDREWTSPAGHTLAGTLTVPAAEPPKAVVLFLGGAGPNTRDYALVSGFRPSLYELVTEQLLCHGIATASFDEVGTGRSTGSYAEHASTSTLAADAGAVAAALRNDETLRRARVFVVGHSEGGTIAAIMGSHDPTLAGLVLLAAPVYRGEDIMRFQRESHRAAYGTSTEAFDRLDRERRATDRWYRAFLEFDPSPVYPKVAAPVLVVQGDRDVDVSPAQADSIRALLLSGIAPFVRCVTIKGSDHTLTDPDAGLWVPHAAVVREVVAFIVERAADAGTSDDTSDPTAASCQRR